MSSPAKAFIGAAIHDGSTLLRDHALLVAANGQISLCEQVHIPEGCQTVTLDGGTIVPGFVDLQVNGGGGVMFNDDPSVETLQTIATAHAGLGTAALLPTLITDTPEKTRAAIDTAESAIKAGIPGILGIHLEGPHLAPARKGAHDAALIRPMLSEDLALLLKAADRLPNVMVTLAPENTTLAQIKTLAEAGIIVSLGHSDADFGACMAAFDAGASCTTHLFNAMSQMTPRAPGLVGATLARDDVFAGLIADGIHVHPEMIKIALAAKRAPEKIFLVTDAMATAGSSIDSFMLNGRQVIRKKERLTLEDGTLAGADLSLQQAISVMTDQAGDTLTRAIARATSTPATLLRHADGFGQLTGLGRAVNYLKPGQPVERLNID